MMRPTPDQLGRARNLLAGLLDAGAGSLATFLVGIYAVRSLDEVVLGGYGLVYQLVFLTAIVPATFVFGPVETEVVDDPAGSRLLHLPRSLLLGVGPAVAAGSVVALWPLVAPAEIPRQAAVALATTGAAVAVLSPIQDHVRRMLHSGERSWRAAVGSVVQLLTVLVALAALSRGSRSAAAVPFAALGLANLVSLLTMMGPQLRQRRSPHRPLQARALARRGGWLVAGGLLNPAAGFVAASIVAAMAGAAAVGYAEAARVIAQPVWVLAVGLSAVLSPRLMAARRSGDTQTALRIRRRFLVAVAGTGGAVAVWFGAAWAGNPLDTFLRPAYVVPGLVALSVLAQTLTGAAFPYRAEMLGLNGERRLLRLEINASVARIIPSVFAGAFGAIAVPVGLAGAGLARILGSRLALRRCADAPAQLPVDA